MKIILFIIALSMSFMHGSPPLSFPVDKTTALVGAAGAYYGAGIGSVVHLFSRRNDGSSWEGSCGSHALAGIIAAIIIENATKEQKKEPGSWNEMVMHSTASAFYGGLVGSLLHGLSGNKIGSSYTQSFASHALAGMMATSITYAHRYLYNQPTENRRAENLLDVGLIGAFYVLAGYLASTSLG